MGYDIHITRRSDWSEQSLKSIAAEEWIRVAAHDPSLQHAPDSGENFYEFPEGDGWFDLVGGNVSTKNPNEATLLKAHELAVKLRAKVQGDDGAVYLPNGEHIGDNVQVVTKYPWWLLGLCVFSIGCFVVIVLHIIKGG